MIVSHYVRHYQLPSHAIMQELIHPVSRPRCYACHYYASPAYDLSTPLSPFTPSAFANPRHRLSNTHLEPSIPNRLRIPKHLPRIDHILNAHELLIRRAIIIRRMRLTRAQARVHVVQIAAKDGAGHLADQTLAQSVDEADAGGRIRAVGVAGEAVVLNHPQRGAV